MPTINLSFLENLVAKGFVETVNELPYQEQRKFLKEYVKEKNIDITVKPKMDNDKIIMAISDHYGWGLVIEDEEV